VFSWKPSFLLSTRTLRQDRQLLHPGVSFLLPTCTPRQYLQLLLPGVPFLPRQTPCLSLIISMNFQWEARKNYILHWDGSIWGRLPMKTRISGHSERPKGEEYLYLHIIGPFHTQRMKSKVFHSPFSHRFMTQVGYFISKATYWSPCFFS
jgi:hypothetical protein